MKLTERGPEYESVNELLICQFNALIGMLIDRQVFKGYTEQQVFEELNMRADQLLRNSLAHDEADKQAREIWERAQAHLRRDRVTTLVAIAQTDAPCVPAKRKESGN